MINEENSITFYFDFSSSYSYISQARIAEIEEKTGRRVIWQPIVLGLIFKKLDHRVPSVDSVKMQYLLRDLERCAKQIDISYKTPVKFPFNSMEAMRIFYFLESTSAALAIDFAKRIFGVAYRGERDVSDSKVVSAELDAMGLCRDEITSSVDFEAAKSALKLATQTAVDRGVFGAPSFIYKGELFWGADRIDTLIGTVLGED